MKLGILGAVLLLALAASRAQTPSKTAAPASAPTQTSAVPGTVQASAAIQGPVQPIPFSHKVHAGTLQMGCEYCHTMTRSGDSLKIPQAHMCMQCHQAIATANPGVQKLAAYAKAEQPIPWVRVYQLPSFVSFSHKVHLAHGNTCQECHGQVAAQTRVFKAMDISMAGCIRCHRAKQAPVECDTCHELQQ